MGAPEGRMILPPLRGFFENIAPISWGSQSLTPGYTRSPLRGCSRTTCVDTCAVRAPKKKAFRSPSFRMIVFAFSPAAFHPLLERASFFLPKRRDCRAGRRGAIARVASVSPTILSRRDFEGQPGEVYPRILSHHLVQDRRSGLSRLVGFDGLMAAILFKISRTCFALVLRNCFQFDVFL
jgi:hypothetical protein